MQQDTISAFQKNLNDLEETVNQGKRVPAYLIKEIYRLWSFRTNKSRRLRMRIF